MKHFSPKGTDFEIIRLEEGLIWKFNPKDKSYQELTFEDIRKMFVQGETDADWPETNEEAQVDSEQNDTSEYE